MFITFRHTSNVSNPHWNQWKGGFSFPRNLIMQWKSLLKLRPLRTLMHSWSSPTSRTLISKTALTFCSDQEGAQLGWRANLLRMSSLILLNCDMIVCHAIFIQFRLIDIICSIKIDSVVLFSQCDTRSPEVDSRCWCMPLFKYALP